MACSIRKRSWKTPAGEDRTAWVVDYKDQHGKRRLKTFKRKKDADAFAATASFEVQQGTHTADSASVTFRDAAEAYFERKERQWRSASRRVNRSIYEYHVAPAWAGVKLSRITTPGIEAWKDAMAGEKSPYMATRALQLFKTIMSDAQRRGLVSNNTWSVVRPDHNGDDNPVVSDALSAADYGTVIPTNDEVAAMLEACPDHWRPLLRTALFTGLRASELRGLTWSDVDLDREKPCLHVRQRADENNKLGPCKTKAARRTVPLTPELRRELMEWKLRCPKGELGLVFPTGRGTVRNHAHLYRDFLDPVSKAAGVVDGDGNRKYTMHQLRHWFASWMLTKGFRMDVLTRRMGHTDFAFTYRVYTHLVPEDDAAKLAEAEADVLG